jgi:hypothetical protein
MEKMCHVFIGSLPINGCHSVVENVTSGMFLRHNMLSYNKDSIVSVYLLEMEAISQNK